MKSIILSTVILGLTMSCSRLVAQEADPVKKANKQNELKADKNMVDEDAAEFLVKAADARMMDLQEGKLAAERGTTASVRSYGKLMVKDQTNLLAQIKKLAATRNISLPSAISDNKQDGREDLAGKTGKDFDEKFAKMMKLDHQRDVKLFTRAKDCKDAGVSNFATKNLPMIESHLARIKALKKDME